MISPVKIATVPVTGRNSGNTTRRTQRMRAPVPEFEQRRDPETPSCPSGDTGHAPAAHQMVEVRNHAGDVVAVATHIQKLM